MIEKTAAKLKASAKSKTYRWGQIRFMGVILAIESERKLKEISVFLDRIEQENPNLRMHLLLYFDTKEIPDYAKASRFYILTKKQIGFNGKIKSGTIDQWFKQIYQIVINAEPNKIELRLPFLMSKGSLKVMPSGKYSEKDADLIVQIPDEKNVIEKLETVIYYLKLIYPSK